MNIKASEFERPDPNRPDYSQLEIDFYGSIVGRGSRLSLRKNLKKNLFEVFKHHEDTKVDEVCYTYSSLVDAVRIADQITLRVTGTDPEDVVVE